MPVRIIGAILLAAIVGVPARAQQPVVAYEGVEIFCHVLHHLGFEPVADSAVVDQYEPDQLLIVVLGDLAPLDRLLSHIRPEAAAWLIASSQSTGEVARRRTAQGFTRDLRNSRLQSWNLMIAAAEVNQPPPRAYRDLPRCPLITRSLDQNHPALQGVKRLATNRPAYLASIRSDLFLLAAFERGARAQDGADLASENLGFAFGARGDSDQRVLILAGEGVFINGMLAQPDNDNFRFALNAARWLKNEQRRYALVLHRGQPVTRFDLPLTGPVPVPIPPVAVLNQMLRELEEERFLQRLLHEEVGPDNLLRFALIVGTVGLALYGVKRLFGARYVREKVPLVVGQTGPTPLALPVHQQRQQELLMQDNLWELAQGLARQWFLEHAGVQPPWWDEFDAGPPQPRIAGNWLVRQNLQRQLTRLWNYARRDPAERVKLGEFERVAALHAQLTRAVRGGRLAFEPARS